MSYAIGQISKLTGLTGPTLRYYEQEGLLSVQRDAAGRRIYTEQDVEWLHFIKRLKETGMPIREIRRYAQLRYQGSSTMQERLAMLEEHHQNVLAEQQKLAENLRKLEEKLAFYRQALQKENRTI
ncbi:MAG: MerR family transcriptional regulator [Anaeromusa sp.]|uniref:MerR family transcriptional regulator n=1 Tax=Anaeromusa sp. TaxID=1872520 RepID=UPI002B1FDEFC|nr:MerR family transcriptional regulator [Anaeromusa sp.]MEA4834441.1 MerR family transcriptional regulator [Anaeromusa sp.]